MKSDLIDFPGPTEDRACRLIVKPLYLTSVNPTVAGKSHNQTKYQADSNIVYLFQKIKQRFNHSLFVSEYYIKI